MASLLGGSHLSATAATTHTYYVDCSAGNDTNSGLQTSLAWRSLTKANAAALQPGDNLLFKRGCAWTGPLNASWSGTAAAPIFIGAYGSGARPTIQNAHDNVVITGSYLIFDSLYTRADPPAYDSGCDNNPMGWRVGFRFQPGSANDILRYSEASNLYIGVLVEPGSAHNKILNNLLQNNNMKSDDLSSDSGGVAISLEGDSNEVAYNYISGSDMCSRQYGRDGAAVEVYGGHYNTIHHNTAVDNNNFVELGLSGSSDNTIAYNVVRAYETMANFLVVHALKDANGPTYRTRVYNNSVYLTGSQSYAIQCAQGCGTNVLTLKNNIVWSEWSIGYADAPFDESNNLFWNASGKPAVWFSTSSTDLRANPQWVNPGSGDFHLQSTSPAINHGSLDSVTAGYTSDLDGTLVPQGTGVDIGAYEYHGPAATSTSSSNLVVNGSFENTGADWQAPWQFKTHSGAGAQLYRDTSTAEDGVASAKVNISQSNAQPYYVQLQSGPIALSSGHTYTLSFWAKANWARTIQVAVQQVASPNQVHVVQQVTLSTQWKSYTISVPVTFTDAAAAVEFNLATNSGQVWLDKVSLS